MKRFIGLLTIALVIVIVLIFVTNPELLNKVWLYIIGFIGYIVMLGEKGVSVVKKAFGSDKIPPDNLSQNISNEQGVRELSLTELEKKVAEVATRLNNDPIEGKALGNGTVTILRYLDDGESTLGLLFLRNQFFAYTLEDTFRAEKIHGKTRIPEGFYSVDFLKEQTPKTLAYRNSRPWFDYHLEIKNVPNFSNIYIHVGNTHEDTKGCILIADGVNASTSKSVAMSRQAYERFYKKISSLLKSNEKVNIQIYDEDWFEKSKMTTI
ncbi:hypothetical protein IFO69_09780 [Echinicola sp. CAU 1574]|uniref:DUF5675 domain-containing protein n=1 Tax=Echinicola arenosa TaxID=2774144 RepID=A0ABR9AN46_9BACT|nr:DUF5675 family protein [Echinicola arenosa]MBD8489034.1 hypothetical protein [Echinicola arenosa]